MDVDPPFNGWGGGGEGSGKRRSRNSRGRGRNHDSRGGSGFNSVPIAVQDPFAADNGDIAHNQSSSGPPQNSNNNFGFSFRQDQPIRAQDPFASSSPAAPAPTTRNLNFGDPFANSGGNTLNSHGTRGTSIFGGTSASHKKPSFNTSGGGGGDPFNTDKEYNVAADPFANKKRNRSATRTPRNMFVENDNITNNAFKKNPFQTYSNIEADDDAGQGWPKDTHVRNQGGSFGSEPAMNNEPFPTPEKAKYKATGPERPQSHELLLRSIPPGLCSEDEIKMHFESTANVVVLKVSLRVSRSRYRTSSSSQTALLTFHSIEDATNAMRYGRQYQGENLNISYFTSRASQQPQMGSQATAERPFYSKSDNPPVEMRNIPTELLLNWVPDGLADKKKLTAHMEQGNRGSVVFVNIKQKPHKGGRKRTALIKFKTAAAAESALQFANRFQGNYMQLSFRKVPKTEPAEEEKEADHPYVKTPPPSPPNRKWVEVTRVPYEEENEEPSNPPVLSLDPTAKVSELDREAEELRNKIESLKRKDGTGKKQGTDGVKQKNGKTNGKSKMSERMQLLKNKALAGKNGSSNNNGYQLTKSDSRKKDNAATKKRPRMNIEDAVRLIGTCPTMCPEDEMYAREEQRDLSIFERLPGADYSVDTSRAVKKYRRSAALSEAPEPEEIRPSDVLAKTMDYLKKLCDDPESADPFYTLHNFVRDRTRSIRQDFTFQGSRDDNYVRILEECVRFHIMSEHKLHDANPEVFSSKQNLEQLDKCLITLRDIYFERKKSGLDTSENEAEMQAYYLLLHVEHANTRVQVYSGLSESVFKSEEVQFAHRVSEMISASFTNYVGFFRMIREAEYLVACLLHRYFGKVRLHAVNVLGKAYSSGTKVIPVAELKNWLGFDSDEQVWDFCEQVDWHVSLPDDGKTHSGFAEIRRVADPEYSSWTRSNVLIESKAVGIQFSDIISGTDIYEEDDPDEDVIIERKDGPANVNIQGTPEKNEGMDRIQEAAKTQSPSPLPLSPAAKTLLPSTSSVISKPALSAIPFAVLDPPKTNTWNPAAKPFSGIVKPQEERTTTGITSSSKRVRENSNSNNVGQLVMQNTLFGNTSAVNAKSAERSGQKRKKGVSFNPQIDDSGTSPTKKRTLNADAATFKPQKKASNQQPFGLAATTTTPITPRNSTTNASASSLPQTPFANAPLFQATPSRPAQKVSFPATAAITPPKFATGTSARAIAEPKAARKSVPTVTPVPSQEDLDLQEEKRRDKEAFERLEKMEKEFGEIACQPDACLDVVEKEVVGLAKWKRNPKKSFAKLTHLAVIVEKITSGLKELVEKVKTVEPVLADTEEKKEWILVDCEDDLEFARKLWKKLWDIRKNVKLALIRAGASIGTPMGQTFAQRYGTSN